MRSTGIEKEKAKEKGRWREENGGPVKCRWRVLERRGGGCVTGALQFIFSIQRAPPTPFSPLPIVPRCDSWSWRCEGENKKKKKKNELAVQPESVDPRFLKKQSWQGGPPTNPKILHQVLERRCEMEDATTVNLSCTAAWVALVMSSRFAHLHPEIWEVIPNPDCVCDCHREHT